MREAGWVPVEGRRGGAEEGLQAVVALQVVAALYFLYFALHCETAAKMVR